MKTRCTWATGSSLIIDYHDHEWGVPVRNDQRLFEFLTLEGAQAGLNWLTILKKRHNYRKAFSGFDPLTVARFDEKEINQLLRKAGIIRNKLKIQSTVINAQAILKIRDEYGSFEKYIWDFVDNRPIKNSWTSLNELPSETHQSKQMSIDMRKRGFKFVGPVTCYAFMQAVGMVNDHEVQCFRHNKV